MNLFEKANINNIINKLHKKSIHFFLYMKGLAAKFVRGISKIPEKLKPFFRNVKSLGAGLAKGASKIPGKLMLFFQSVKNLGVGFARGVLKIFKKLIQFFLYIVAFFGIIGKGISILNNKFKQSIQYQRELAAVQSFRIDIFLIIFILILIVSPIVFNQVQKSEVKSKQVNLFLSLQYEDFLGKEMAEQLLEEFNEKNPDILIRLLDFETAVPELPAPAAAGRQQRVPPPPPPPPSPDIFLFDEGDFGALVAEGLLADLSYYFEQLNTVVSESETESEDEDFDDAPPVAIMQLTSQFAVPLVSFMDMLFYNTEILTAAGFDHPPKSRDDFLACVRAVSRGNFPGIIGTALSLSPEDKQAVSRDIFSWIWAAGGDFWTEEDNLQVAPASYNTRAVANDLTFFSTLFREVQSHGIFEQTGDQRIKEFADGHIALLIASTRYIPYLREQMKEGAFGVTTIPVPAVGGKYGKSLSSIYAGISSDSLHPEEAWRFLKFLAEKNALFCTKLSAVPGSVLNLIPGDYVRNDPFYSKAWDIFEASHILKGFSGMPNTQEYEATFLEELQVFFDGGRTALQTVVAIQRRWDEEQE